jgi:glycosyltransferase involved in cell wall biosynthesis
LEKRIIFTGMVNKNELRYAYSRCKLFVFPSLCESSGYTLIEAMSCGSPILASDRTAIPYTCNNAAEYFDAYSKDDLQKKLQNLLSDPDKLLNMKKKSISRSEEMIDYKAATNQFIEIVNKK